MKITIVSDMQKQARRTDSHDMPLRMSDNYILRSKRIDQRSGGYLFFGGGTWGSPSLVEDVSDALRLSGGKLQDIGYDWTLNWEAVQLKTPADVV